MAKQLHIFIFLKYCAREARKKKSLFTACPDVSIGVTWSVISRIEGQQQIRTICQGLIWGIFRRPVNAKVSGFLKKFWERPPSDWKMSGFPDKSGRLEALISSILQGRSSLIFKPPKVHPAATVISKYSQIKILSLPALKIQLKLIW